MHICLYYCVIVFSSTYNTVINVLFDDYNISLFRLLVLCRSCFVSFFFFYFFSLLNQFSVSRDLLVWLILAFFLSSHVCEVNSAFGGLTEFGRPKQNIIFVSNQNNFKFFVRKIPIKMSFKEVFKKTGFLLVNVIFSNAKFLFLLFSM